MARNHPQFTSTQVSQQEGDWGIEDDDFDLSQVDLSMTTTIITQPSDSARTNDKCENNAEFPGPSQSIVTEILWGSDDDEDWYFSDIESENLEAVVCEQPDEMIPVVIQDTVSETAMTEENSCAAEGKEQTVLDDPFVSIFPGPAGIRRKSSVAAGKLLMRAKPVYLKDVEKTYGWSRAMKKLDIDIELSTKFNIKFMKEKFPINTFCSIKIPYILVGIKSFHGRKSDLLCVVEDPSGEARVIIHRDVVEKLGKKLALGVVLFIRRPAILMMEPTPYMITVTGKTLLAVVDAVEAWVTKKKKDPSSDGYLSEEDGYGFLGTDDWEKKSQIIQCIEYSRSDVQTWSSEEFEGELLSSPVDLVALDGRFNVGYRGDKSARLLSRQPVHTSAANRESNEEKRRRLTAGRAACESDAVASTSKK